MKRDKTNQATWSQTSTQTTADLSQANLLVCVALLVLALATLASLMTADKVVRAAGRPHHTTCLTDYHLFSFSVPAHNIVGFKLSLYSPE